jgi:hypothetical protein
MWSIRFVFLLLDPAPVSGLVCVFPAATAAAAACFVDCLVSAPVACFLFCAWSGCAKSHSMDHMFSRGDQN